MATQNYTIWTYDYNGYGHVIGDALNGKFTSTAPGGYESLTFDVPRAINKQYPDLGVNFHTEVRDPHGDIAWEGSLSNISKTTSTGDGGLSVTALGYAAFLNSNNEVAIAYGGAATDISNIVSANITPLVTAGYFTSADIYPTGVSIRYANDVGINNTTSAKTTVRGLLDKLLLYGDSNGNFFNWYIGSNRKFRWLVRPASYTLMCNQADASAVDIEDSNNSQYKNVVVTYKDIGTASILTVTSSNTQSQYVGATQFAYPPGAPGIATVPTITTKTLDVRDQGFMSATQALRIADTLVKQFSGKKITANKMGFTRPNAITDTLTGGNPPLGQIKPGNITLVPDLTNSDWTAMQPFNTGSTANQFYIAKTSYDIDNGLLELEPEQGRSFDTLIKRLVYQSTHPDSPYQYV